MIYTVRFQGAFGFIKPWTAVRDELTFSQQFLTPSIIEGMRQKLQVDEILRHKLSFTKFSKQQEQTRPKLIKKWGSGFSIIERGLMIEPRLTLGFKTRENAQRALEQHLCLCRNEDIVLPDGERGIKRISTEEFDEIPGFELRFTDSDDGFIVGYNRFEDYEPMYGSLEITGDAIKNETL
ncbi:MAG TPA: hypothetical protein VJ964_04925 [Balneolaceae bacterium]|nr:hypothetical protein [Balneolaceae bacterium]